MQLTRATILAFFFTAFISANASQNGHSDIYDIDTRNAYPEAVYPQSKLFTRDSYHGTLHNKRGRVTIEECIKNIPNRFQLIMLATQRARQISKGSLPSAAEEKAFQDLKAAEAKCK